jgi:hypothetical protein
MKIHALVVCSALVLTLSFPIVVPAKDVSGLYDRATLQQLAPRYERTTKKMLDQLIFPALRTQERQRLEGIRVVHPLEAEGSLKGEPLMFYAEYPRVVLPIFSLKFLDDLCTATAWLQVNGYSIETVADYVAMLRFKTAQDFPGGRYPPPLPSLGIPANALSDPRVDELALNHFVTARAFILVHELGHLYHRHVARTLPESQQNEREADRFAAVVLQRTPVTPLGSLIFFTALAHWADYPPQDLRTHPLTGERLHALARHIDSPELSRGIDDLGTRLDDPEIWAGIAATIRATDPATLAPRRSRQLPHLTGASPQRPQARGLAFQGSYIGTAGQYSDSGPIPITTVFERQGDRVAGQYSFGLGLGRIEGTVRGNTLHFDWQWAGNYGRGKLEASDRGAAFSGTWGYRESSDNAGRWDGRRQE